MGYKTIVLLGIDPQTSEHFMFKNPALEEEAKLYYTWCDPKGVFESMIPKGNRYRTIAEYYFALRELYFGPREIELRMGVPNPILSPRIPAYAWKVPSAVTP